MIYIFLLQIQAENIIRVRIFLIKNNALINKLKKLPADILTLVIFKLVIKTIYKDYFSFFQFVS